jgi:hypothetical protein
VSGLERAENKSSVAGVQSFSAAQMEGIGNIVEIEEDQFDECVIRRTSASYSRGITSSSGE